MNHKIVYKRADQLHPYENNARVHSDYQIKKLADSIKVFGFTNPVLLAEDDMIISGHGRVLAAMRVGLELIPTITLKDLTPRQIRAYIIADNKLAEMSTWDEELLKIELDSLSSEDIDITLIGFDEFEAKFNDGDDEEDSNNDSIIGSKELNPEDFDNFDNKCPKCGFEWDNKK